MAIASLKDRLDISEWNLSASDQMKKVFMQAVEEVLELATKDAVNVRFLSDRDEGYATDALGLRIGIPLAGNQGEEPEWHVSLCEVVEDEISMLVDVDGLASSDEEIKRLARIRDSLRSLADKIDAVIAVE